MEDRLMASFTINTPPGQDARILAAFGKRLNTRDAQDNPRPATGAEVKQQIIQFPINAVQEQEHNTAVQAAAATVTPVTPS